MPRGRRGGGGLFREGDGRWHNKAFAKFKGPNRAAALRGIGTGGNAGGGLGAGAAAEGIAGFSFSLTMDDSDFQADVAEAEARLQGLSTGAVSGAGGKRPVITGFGERVESRVRALNARIVNRARSIVGLGPASQSAIEAGGRRASFFEFGAEGARIGDLRLSRSGLSLSEKTFVGSRTLGYVAVAGQVVGHIIRGFAKYDDIIRAHMGQVPAGPGQEETQSATASAHARTIGDLVVGGAYNIATQAASIFGGEELGGLLVWGLRAISGAGRATFRQSVQDAKTNREAIADALNFPVLLEKYRSRAVKRQIGKLKERQAFRSMWDGVREEQEMMYASDEAHAAATLRQVGFATKERLSKVKDVRGNPILPNPYYSEMEGR